MLLSNTPLLLACEPGTLGLIFIFVFVGFLVAKRLARADQRRLVLLGALVVAAFVLVFHLVQRADRSNAQFQSRQAETMARAQQEAARAMAKSQQEAARSMVQAQQEVARSMASDMAEKMRSIVGQSDRRLTAGVPAPPMVPAAPTMHPQPGIVQAQGPVVAADPIVWSKMLVLILLVVGIGFGLAKGLSRAPAPTFAFLGALVAVGIVFFLLHSAPERVSVPGHSTTEVARVSAPPVAPPVPAPPVKSAVEPKHLQPGVLEALAKALQNVSSDRTAAPTIILVATDSVRVLRNALSDRPNAPKTPVKPNVKEPARAVEAADAPPPPTRPAWVDAAPKMEGDAYVMAKQVGPYTALPECERELPKILEQAVAEYAELLLGREKARDVHLPDDVLEGLVRQRWTEHLAQEFGGAVQDMVVLHVLIGLDPLAQERIREASDHSVAVRRMQGAGVALGGVLGLLALAWCGLSVFGGRQEPKPPQEAQDAAEKTSCRRWTPAATLAVFVAVAIAIATACFVGR